MAGITETISNFIANTKSCDIDPVAMSVMRLSFLDWMAVGHAGRDEPVSRITRAMALSEGGSPQSGLIGSAIRLPARSAALVNGTTSHALDYDDTHFAHIGHPSVAVISAALAVAQREGVSGKTLQECALIGVEASIRIGVWLGRDHYQTGFHQTGTAGAFGATAACARLMRFTPEQTAMALGLVATRASGLKAQFGTMGKPYNAGQAAANGVEAATLVSLGFEANPEAMECPQGFGPTHHGMDVKGALQGVGKKWLFESISHKFHACCHGLHAALEAAASLDVANHDITAIDVTTHPRWMSVCNQPAPGTGLGAKFSYSTVLAMHFLGHDTARLDSFSDGLCRDHQVAALRQRVSVTADAALSETAARLQITLSDGQVLRAEHDLNAAMDLPLRREKVLAKAASLLGDDRAKMWWQMIENEANPSELAAVLSA